MAKITTIEEGIESIYRKNEFGEVPEWKFIPRTGEEFTDSIELNGETFPVFAWRGEPQTASVANSALRSMGLCRSVKISGAISKTVGLNRFLYKELETAEWMLGSEIKHLTAFVNDKSCNAILRMKNDKVAVLELGANLPDGADEQTRHTAWGTKGMASTRVVSEKIRPQAVYLYNNDPIPTTYNDNMSALYGLSQDDCVKTVTIAMMLLGKVDYRAWKSKHEKLLKYIEAIYKSSELGERVTVGGDE